jgi:hypothetical protein
MYRYKLAIVLPQQGLIPTAKGKTANVTNKLIIVDSSHLPSFISRRSAMALQQAFVIAQLHHRRNNTVGLVTDSVAYIKYRLPETLVWKGVSSVAELLSRSSRYAPISRRLRRSPGWG